MCEAENSTLRVMTIGTFFERRKPRFELQSNYSCSTMQSAKINQIIRAGIGLLLVALVYVIYAGIHERIVIAGDSAPQFNIKTDNGRGVSVPNFGGKLLVLNFWASWCQ